MDTAADVNVMSINVYKELFLDYSLSELRPVQANLRVYASSHMTVIELYVLHHKTQSLTFSITYQEGSMCLSCDDTFSPGLL